MPYPVYLIQVRTISQRCDAWYKSGVRGLSPTLALLHQLWLWASPFLSLVLDFLRG